MTRVIFSGVILGLCLLSCCGTVVAAEGDELKERAKALRQKAASIIEQRNKEQAELLAAADQLEMKAKRGGEQSVRPGIEEHVQHLHQRLHKLVEQEQKLSGARGSESELVKIREMIGGTKHELEQIHAQHHGKPDEHHPGSPEFRENAQKLESISHRIQHMRAAAVHLKQAEMTDIAHQLTEKANELERNVREAKHRLESQMREAHGNRADHLSDVVRELRGEIERLRAEVKELSRKVEKR